MSASQFKNTDPYKILVVDDEPDIFKVTELSLKKMKFKGLSLEFLSAKSGEEAIQVMLSNPDVAVILLDVVMENKTAGLDVVHRVRNELNNTLVRIILRTGQPGVAPEQQVIDEYDIDGYLPKAELNSTRLYSAVRTALKAWTEMAELERYRECLAIVHDCVVSLHAYDSPQLILEQILETAIRLCPTSLGIAKLETLGEHGNPVSYRRSLNIHSPLLQAEQSTQHSLEDIETWIKNDLTLQELPGPSSVENGFYMPIRLAHQIGSGWVYLTEVTPDSLIIKSLTLLTVHAANVLYASVAQKMMQNGYSSLHDTLGV